MLLRALSKVQVFGIFFGGSYSNGQSDADISTKYQSPPTYLPTFPVFAAPLVKGSLKLSESLFIGCPELFPRYF